MAAQEYDTKIQAKALATVRSVVEAHLAGNAPEFQVYLVWHCFILGNWKSLIATTMDDGMYYEVTYNAAKKEMYVDSYMKVSNIMIPDMFSEGQS